MPPANDPSPGNLSPGWPVQHAAIPAAASPPSAAGDPYRHNEHSLAGIALPCAGPYTGPQTTPGLPQPAVRPTGIRPIGEGLRHVWICHRAETKSPGPDKPAAAAAAGARSAASHHAGSRLPPAQRSLIDPKNNRIAKVCPRSSSSRPLHAPRKSFFPRLVCAAQVQRGFLGSGQERIAADTELDRIRADPVSDMLPGLRLRAIAARHIVYRQGTKTAHATGHNLKRKLL